MVAAVFGEPTSGAGDLCRQGSRMSLVCDDLEHVAVVPGSLLAPATEAGLGAPGAWCTDRLVGVEELGGVGERPFPAPGADRAVQAEPGPPPPHPAPAAPGHELAGLRRQLTPARKFDGLVHRRSAHSLEG